MDLIGDNVFVAKFKIALEMNRVFRSGPWTFDKSLVVLVVPTDVDDPMSLSFTTTSFWVQIQRVPFKFLTRDMAIKLGQYIGRVEEVGPVMRVRVALDKSKPLRR